MAVAAAAVAPAASVNVLGAVEPAVAFVAGTGGVEAAGCRASRINMDDSAAACVVSCACDRAMALPLCGLSLLLSLCPSLL